ncbi:helix-turn-helix transcriptional regulator [Brevibacillus ginsengisoli]|uniref:helix-turn-helix transcriptional regulator n=1 Tax=Brevibacillus ginsengisoli TaxID=363854 RepID=UPI003CED40EA
MTNLENQLEEEISLRAFMDTTQISLPEFLQIALRLSDRIGHLHQYGFIHKELNPDNIFVELQTMKVNLLGYDKPAPPIKEKREADLSAMLPYMSPEMTGRVNRKVDGRADLYSIGIIFYEMLTGRLPFEADDSIKWAHVHIAKKPEPVIKWAPKLPRPVSDIIMKLISKEQGERYQSAYGLRNDLELCLFMWRQTGTVSDFSLGQRENIAMFQWSDRLYGREREIGMLNEIYQWTCLGTTEMIGITGPAGIGKTTLVHEFRRRLVGEKREWGRFIQGKFEQYNRDVPYAPLVEGFRELIRQVLTEEERIDYWKEKLHTALGADAGVISALVPELKLLVGDLPEGEILPLAESRLRFQLRFRSFVQVFARKECPLILFLDDLQWADTDSLQMIHSLLTDSESESILLIGAFRDHEVDSTHPLFLPMHEIRQSGVGVHFLPLSAPTLSDFNQLVSTSLECDEAQTREITELLYQKADGNPFFFKQLFQTSYLEQKLSYDPKQETWGLNGDGTGWEQPVGNLLDFMVEKIKRLPGETQMALSLAACLGSRFELELLAEVEQVPLRQLASELSDAVREGLIVPVSSFMYSFLHDRIQQAAYLLLDEESRKRFHWKVGLYLQKSSAIAEQTEELFDWVNHLNLGADCITEETELVQLMEGNLAAGRKAKSSSAYKAAAAFFRAGLSLVTEKNWESRFELIFDLSLERMESEYLCGHFDVAEELAKQLNERSRNRMERAAICKVITAQYVNMGKYSEAISLGLELLKEFGIHLSANPSQLVLMEEMLVAKEDLGRHIDRLHELPPMESSEGKMIVELMFTLVAPSFFFNKEFYTVLISRCVTLTLQYGLTPVSPAVFAGYAMILGMGLEDYRMGYQLGEIAIQLAEKTNIQSVKCKTYTMFGAVISRWLHHARVGETYLEQALKFGLESGDYVFASFAMGARINSFYTRKNLIELKRWIGKYMETLAETRDEFVIDNFVLFQYWIASLQGMTKDPASFDTDAFAEDAFLDRIQNTEFKATTLFQYYSYKVQVNYLIGNFAEAIEYAMEAKPYELYAAHLPHLQECCFYESLAIASGYAKVSANDKEKLWKQLEQNHLQFKKWSEYSLDNYSHKLLLIEAEMARLTNDDGKAIQLYEQAIRSAMENDYAPSVAVANERAAYFYREKGVDNIARFYAANAYEFYIKWGAVVKAKLLLEEFPHLELTKAVDSEAVLGRDEKRIDALEQVGGTDGSNTGSGTLAAQNREEHTAQLDLATILKASQTVSEEMDLGKLLERLMALIIENAGAQKGVLVMERDGLLSVEVALDIESGEGVTFESGSPERSGKTFDAILRDVSQTREAVILEDAMNEGEYTNDPYVVQNELRSILCAPILVQGELNGMLYLENNLMTNAFQRDRLKVLHMLGAQVSYVKKLLAAFGETAIAVQERTKEDVEVLVEPLTERELEVLNLMAAGLSNMEIADQLMIVVGTVKYHVKNIFSKLNVNRRTKAVAEAKKYKLLNVE